MEKSSNNNETTTDVYTVLGVVNCPNNCCNGMVKLHDYHRALYDLVKCSFCKGKGKVTIDEANAIERVL